MLIAEYRSYNLHFNFQAGTSKGVLTNRHVYILRLHFSRRTSVSGFGECSVIPGISPDDTPNYEKLIERACADINRLCMSYDASWQNPIQWLERVLDATMPIGFPSIKFGFETALLDLVNGGKRQIIATDFIKGKIIIPINGLVWMNTIPQMRLEAFAKINAGFNCIKIKIGALNWQEELDLLREIRESEAGAKVILRVDANGAFNADNVFEKLADLAEFNLHSIEQPIEKGQWPLLSTICKQSPVPIALDEELSGSKERDEKIALLRTIKPQYIVLKPSMVGGLYETKEWIEVAESLNIAWWITSALESNIGLNAIAQFTAQYSNLMHQGLGTGKLYQWNFESPLQAENGFLQYSQEKQWDDLDAWWNQGIMLL